MNYTKLVKDKSGDLKPIRPFTVSPAKGEDMGWVSWNGAGDVKTKSARNVKFEPQKYL